MDCQETPNFFQQQWKRTLRKFTDFNQTGCSWRQVNPQVYTSVSKALEIERADRAATYQSTERLCSAQKARNDAVLERLGLSTRDGALPSFPRVNTSSPTPHRRRSSPIVLKKALADRTWRSFDEEAEVDEFFWDKIYIGGQIAALACEEAGMPDRHGSPTPSIDSVYSSIDARTPSELKAIPLIEVTNFRRAPVPPAPQVAPQPGRRFSRLPVYTARVIGADKELPTGCKLQSAKSKVQATVETVGRFQRNSVSVPRPPTAANSTHVVEPLAPTPPTVPRTKKRGTGPGTSVRPVNLVTAGNKTTRDRIHRISNDKKVELRPMTNPRESLVKSFDMLSSDDWMKKMDGLNTLQALAQFHPDILRVKLHEVCLVLIQEVKNLRSAVSCAAMNTLAEFYVHLQTSMDPEVEGTGRCLLLKLAQTTNDFIHQQANLALDAMVENCSYGRVTNVLLTTGMSHRCVAVKGSMAQHLHLLAESLGSAHILKAAKSFTVRFLIAVSKMCVDAAPEVRRQGQRIYHKLALHQDFQNLWKKTVPERDRMFLEKILKNARR